MKDTNTYYLAPNRMNGNLDVIYVPPCGAEMKVAYIPKAERREANPIVIFMVSALGLNGLVKIGELMESIKEAPTMPVESSMELKLSMALNSIDELAKYVLDEFSISFPLAQRAEESIELSKKIKDSLKNS